MTDKTTYEELEKRNQELEQAESERKQIEEALRESEKRFRLLAESLLDTVYEFDSKGKFTYVNEAGVRMLGYSKDELLENIQARDTFSKEDHARSREDIGKIFKGKTIVAERTFIRKDGTTFIGEIHSGPTYKGKDVIGVRGVLRDITARKQVEEALRESEEKCRLVMDATTDGLWDWNALSGEVYFSPSWSNMLGELDIAPKYDSWENRIHPNDKEIVLLTLQDHLKGKTDYWQKEHRLRTKIGEWKWVLGRGCVVERDADGQPLRMVGTMSDISDRKQAEAALQKERAAAQEYLDVAGVMMVALNTKGEIILCNKKGCDILGYEESEIIGRNWFSTCLPSNIADEVQGVFAQLMAGQVEPVEFYENPVLTSRGEHRILSFHNTILRDESSKITGILSSGEDITERKQAEENFRESEEKLARSKKMESLGLMAGGIAHDLNNILSGIVSYPELLLMNLPENSPLRKPIKTIKESGLRAADVVSDLLTVARGIATDKEVRSLNVLIEEYLDSFEHKKLAEWRPSVIFKTELDSGLLNVSCSSTHIQKSMMNLVANALEAIEDSGTIIISTANRYLDEPLKGYEDIRIGEYAILSVSDDGLGISSEDLERVFEPFYTKKVMGRSGTGLGLTVVWNTVQDHEGYINVNSSEKGTTFELYFPVTRKEVISENEEISLKHYLGHGEKILVVDDEENQRDIACGLLNSLGYTAEAVSSGQEAIKYVKERPVDLIVLDMIMARDMNGYETYEEIIKIHPRQKAIIASGFAETEDVKAAQKLGAGKYIKKPYTIETIGLAVKEELEE